MKARAYNSNVISKTFAILRAFADEKLNWGVNELARYLDIPASSLHRNLKTLREENILEVSAQTGKYKIGPEFVRIASIISSDIEIKNVARPFMQEVSTMFNESVYLGLYNARSKKISFVEGIHSHNPLKYVLEIGVLQPIHFAASGKTVLAFLETEEIQAVFDEENVSLEEQRIIEKELQLVRDQGFLTTLGERLEGASGTAAPIFDASQKVIGCITCVIPINYYDAYDDSLKENLAKKITEAAEKTSRVLGYRR
ncbi:IclR family transcriptional regulator [Virgibacillus sp. NKC19-3]|uniref:IclR family transcriptional regulator n=1 Tax=Virgibacillus saliphilus TaxID=2831674 RepID=UPI001C9B7C4C|nr:IclR family transcriptional regulator [Virgibacillus sp. NKC19-3]MBY7144504.1 IclR family transcriptional regulator [Virgibacillus sp. NKC19-3]